MSEIKNGRLGLYRKVYQFEELGVKGLNTIKGLISLLILGVKSTSLKFKHIGYDSSDTLMQTSQLRHLNHLRPMC